LPSSQEPREFAGQNFGFAAVAFSPDGKLLAASEDFAGQLNLWNTATGQIHHQLRTTGTNLDALAFSPDGKLLATAERQEKIRLWRASNGALKRELTGLRNSTFDIVFSPDGRTLIAAGRDRMIRLWELDTGTKRRELAGNQGAVLSLALSPDGRTLASGGEDKIVLLHDLTAQSRRASQEMDLERAWTSLLSSDAAEAEKGVASFMAGPVEGVSFLAARLQPVTQVKPERLNRLIADLDHPRYVVRRDAERELETLGMQAGSSLQQVLRGKPSLELRRRAERLLDLVEDEQPGFEELRVLRALELLEQLATKEAARLIERIAAGAPGARPTRQAQSSLARLRR
jgi:dipeptidyl aminopeptidase/acylaminoacyl peptidase